MRNQELFRKYLNKECTTEELQLLYNHLKDDNEELYREIMYDIWKTVQVNQSVEEDTSDRMYEKIMSAIDRKNKPTRSFFLQPQWIAAASLTGILLVAAFVYFIFIFSPFTNHTTAYGETEMVTLSDGTVVHLYANSRLSYPPQWEEQREVWLEGEGYFTVKKVQENNTSFPRQFIVHTSNLDVEVLGTEFNVKDRRGNTQVILNSGLIKLTKIVHDTEELTLVPGDIAEVGKLYGLTITKVPEPEIYSSWKDNYLYFEDMTLQEIARELKDSHGIQIILEDTILASKKINASTPVDDLSILFTTIQKSAGLKVVKNEEKYVISKR